MLSNIYSGSGFWCRSRLSLGQIRVLGVAAFGFADGVFLGVLFEFGREGFKGVDAEVVAEEEDVVEHVGYFVRNFGFIGFYVLFYFGGVLPLEVFQQFGGFEGEGDGYVFGVVELRPVAGVAEMDDLAA